MVFTEGQRVQILEDLSILVNHLRYRHSVLDLEHAHVRVDYLALQDAFSLKTARHKLPETRRIYGAVSQPDQLKLFLLVERVARLRAFEEALAGLQELTDTPVRLHAGARPQLRQLVLVLSHDPDRSARL